MADDFSEKLSAVLGNPDAMGQIMSIAQALSGNSTSDPPMAESEAQNNGTPDYAPITPSLPQSAPGPDLSGILGMLGGLMGGDSGGSGGGSNPLAALADLDPKFLQIGMRLFSEFSNPDDNKTALLAALRPFVKEERFAKVDKAIRIARLSRVIRVALQVFKEGGEKDDV